MRFPFQTSSHSARSRRARAHLRLRFELLEDRAMLAMIAVDTFADVVANDGQTSLREAITQAAATAGDDTIELPAGTYPLALGQLAINDASGSVTIEASGGTATIDARGASRVLEVFGGSVALEGLSITGGLVSGFFGSTTQ